MQKPISQKKLFFLDMDGTIYLDKTVFPDTIPFLTAVKERGAHYLYLTNNSSRSVKAYVEKLAAMGIAATEDEFLTSTDATIVYLKAHYPEDTKMYVFGTTSFRDQLNSAGIRTVTELADDVKVLVMGFDTELTFGKLEDACILLGRGVDYIATNPDYVCPTWYGSVPDCGSIAGILKTATGREPRFIGKPNPEMLLLALEKTGLAAEDALMIGDRVYTDIASGVNAGVDTVLVLSGEGTVEDAEASEKKPTYIMDGIGDVMREFLKN
ncbi:MAG: HAD-IIA family hydrolase [Ruminococcaceae bacterium]|nr:HAD-IIA family hydrolase [Oscillospiraceae bacterium]